MNFCFFSAQYLPTVGGVERYTFNIASLLVKRGHNVTVVTSALSGLCQNERDGHGINVVRVPSRLFMGGRFPFVRITKFFPIIKKVLAGTDFCVIQTRFYPLSAAAALACRKMNVKSIVIDHSTGHMPMGKGVVGKIAHIYEHAVCSLIKMCTGNFYGVSAAVNSWLEHFGIKSKGRLYNAVDPEAIKAEIEGDTTDYRQKLSLPKDCKIVCFAGRLIPEKGVEILIEAFEKCKFENTYLLIAGDGRLYEKLSGEKKEGVYILGSLSHSATMSLMSQADVYCLPTLYAEGFPTTFLEAAACGCPVITTKTGGSGEFMPSGDYGTEIQNLTAETLASALKKAVEDSAWRKKAAGKAFENLTDNFTWEKTCDKLEKTAYDIINNS